MPKMLEMERRKCKILNYCTTNFKLFNKIIALTISHGSVKNTKTKTKLPLGPKQKGPWKGRNTRSEWHGEIMLLVRDSSVVSNGREQDRCYLNIKTNNLRKTGLRATSRATTYQLVWVKKIKKVSWLWNYMLLNQLAWWILSLSYCSIILSAAVR